jgi:hypothetical protein
VNYDFINPQVGALFGIILLLMLVGVIAIGLHVRKQEAVMSTPVTDVGLEQFDDLPPGLAIVHAWSEPGENPRWHRKMQEEVRTQMPVLARALDRLVETNS